MDRRPISLARSVLCLLGAGAGLLVYQDKEWVKDKHLFGDKLACKWTQVRLRDDEEWQVSGVMDRDIPVFCLDLLFSSSMARANHMPVNRYAACT